MTVNDIIQAIGLVGIGGLLKSIIDFLIDDRKCKSEAQHQFKEVRYKAILLLLYSLVYFDKEQDQLKKHRPDINSKENLINEIKAEWTNLILFASDSVILEMQSFINNPSLDNFTNTLLSMRKDLYKLGTKLNSKTLKF